LPDLVGVAIVVAIIMVILFLCAFAQGLGDMVDRAVR
jgi:hypothetical protein